MGAAHLPAERPGSERITTESEENVMNADSTLSEAEKRMRVVFVSLAFALLSAIILSLVYLSTSTTTTATATLSFSGGVSNIFLPCALPLAFIIVPLSMAEGYRKGLAMAVLFGLDSPSRSASTGSRSP